MRLAKAKPCPFCKNTETYMERGDMGYSYEYCNKCGARGPSLIQSWDDDQKDERRCRSLWNARSEPRYKAAIDAAEASYREDLGY